MSESRKNYSQETAKKTMKRFFCIFGGNVIALMLLCFIVTILYNIMAPLTYPFLGGLAALVTFAGGVILAVWSQLFMDEHEIYPYNKCLTIH